MRQGRMGGGGNGRNGFEGLAWPEMLAVLQQVGVAVSVCRVDPAGPARVLADCNEAFVRLSGRGRAELSAPGALDRLQQHGRALPRLLAAASGGLPLTGRYRWRGGVEMEYRAVPVRLDGVFCLVSLERPAGEEARLRGRLRLLSLRLLAVREEVCGEVGRRLSREVAPGLRTCQLLFSDKDGVRAPARSNGPDFRADAEAAPEGAGGPMGGRTVARTGGRTGGPAALVGGAWKALDGLLDLLRLESAGSEELAVGLRRLVARHRRDTGGRARLRLGPGRERLGGLERRVLLYAAAAALEALRQTPGGAAGLPEADLDLRLNVGARQASLVLRAPHGGGHGGLHRRLVESGVEEVLELVQGGLEVSVVRGAARLRLSLPLSA
ncbi:MAG: hypothetical protein AB7D57_08025 [Desulfovibrionaceae bacterium]